MELKECPLCGSRRIHEAVESVTRVRNGNKFKIPNVSFWKCSSCKEKFYSPVAMEQMEEGLRSISRVA